MDLSLYIGWIDYHQSFFFQAEDGIRDQPRSRGLGDVYKRQHKWFDKNMENIIYPWLNEVNKKTETEIEFENNSIPFK